MLHRLQPDALLCLLVLLLASPALAVMGDDDSPRPTADDPDYAAGLAALERADWQGVVFSMGRVVARRPWHDEAHNLMGYAYRKLGDYPRSLQHYQQALDLNPYHRGALEYLGEAYLAMGNLAQAHTTLEQLATVCKQSTGNRAGDSWKADCEEWQELKAAIDSYRTRTP